MFESARDLVPTVSFELIIKLSRPIHKLSSWTSWTRFAELCNLGFMLTPYPPTLIQNSSDLVSQVNFENSTFHLFLHSNYKNADYFLYEYVPLCESYFLYVLYHWDKKTLHPMKKLKILDWKIIISLNFDSL